MNYYAPTRGEAEMPRAQDNLEMLRRGSIDYVIQEMAANTGMEVEHIRALFAWTNDKLKAELTSRHLRFKANASKSELVALVIADMLRIRAAMGVALIGGDECWF